jgi:anti-sigma factor RsiW
MSHVDEGALHAYLDGALDELPPSEAEAVRRHLEECAECMARLETERSVRLDAHAILGMAAPDVELPSLEELRAYVKRTRPPAPATAGRLYRLGWAASIMIAVGAGWMIRDGQLQQRALEQSSRTGPTVAPAAEAPAAGAAGDFSSRADAEREALEADPQTQTVETPEEAPRTSGSAPREARAPSEEAVASPPTVDDRDVGNVLTDATAEVADVVSMTASVDEPASLAPIPSDASKSAAPSSLAEPLAPVTRLVAAGSGADVDSAAGEEAGRAERRRAESLVPITSAMDRSGAVYRAAAADEVERPEEPALAVPGYEVISVTNLGEGTTSVGAYVVQRLDGDTLLEIFHLEAGIDPSVLPAPAEGVREVRLDAESGWVVMRGPLETIQLEELLARLFPEDGR